MVSRLFSYPPQASAFLLAATALNLTDWAYSASLNANSSAAVNTLCVSFGPMPIPNVSKATTTPPPPGRRRTNPYTSPPTPPP